MAEGNDGNLFQHTIEARIAYELNKMGGNKGIYAVFTHGMAPYEACKPAKKEVCHGNFDKQLNVAQANPKFTIPVIKAYNLTKASRSNYPNSAEIVAALVGRNNLSGQIFENEYHSINSLVQIWAGYQLELRRYSWRRLETNEDMKYNIMQNKKPWLLAMDPYGFSQGEFKDDGFVYNEDIKNISSILELLIGTQQPGIFSLISYSWFTKQKGSQRLSASIEKKIAEMPYITKHNNGRENGAFVEAYNWDNKDEMYNNIKEDLIAVGLGNRTIKIIKTWT